MAKSKKRSKKQSNNMNLITKQFNNEIYGIFIIAIGLILLVSIQGSSAGRVGDLIKLSLMGLFSNTIVILPYLVILYGVFVFINKSLLKDKKNMLFYFLIFISVTILKSLNNIETIDAVVYSSAIEWVKQIFFLGTQGIGGGVIGASITRLFVTLFGTTITYIIVFTLLIISLILHTNISLLSILIKIKNKFFAILNSIKNQICNFIFVPVNDKKSNKKNKKKNNKKSVSKLSSDFKKENITNSEKESNMDSEIEEKIKILDFTATDSKDIDKPSDKQNSDDNSKSSNNPQNKLNDNDKSQVNIEYDNEEQLLLNYEFPSIELLDQIASKSNKDDKRKIISKAKILEDTLTNFGVEAKVIQVNKGPTITRYELQPNIGVKVSKIVNLSDDIALNLAAPAIRIEAPIPGKAAIGIEIPNEDTSAVALREVIDHSTYQNSSFKLPFALGKDVSGAPIVTDISKMPHLLVAGATGSGKSVCINTLILSILYNSSPEDVRLVLIDPKVVELNQYNGIPHLLIPVVTDPKKATSALNWAVQEMSKRYKMFAENGVRDIDGYNKKFEENKIPYIVIIIDELADLMMVAPNDVEDTICRLAQMARAAGLHLIIATQRPSVDVITGVIKANIPSRIAFSVASQADSRTILDMGGAEKLLGKGDMLFYPVDANKPVRIQGAFISEKEVERVVTFIKEQTEQPNYEDEIIDHIDQNKIDTTTDNIDELFNDALKIVIENKQASISMLQRKLRIGYNRAARLIDEMEAKGLVGPHEGSKPRQVLVDDEFLEENIKESV